MDNNLKVQDNRVIELQNIYKEMDAEGKETIISAVDRLLYIQRAFRNPQESRKRRLREITLYIVSGIINVCIICFFWEFLIKPVLLNIGITPLTMTRIIVTALIGIFCLGSGFLGFFQRWLKAPLFLLLIIAGMACLDPQILTDLIGILFIALIVTALVVQKKRHSITFSG
jgi:hypothetical protein